MKKRSVNSRKYSLIFATFVALFSICTAGVSTFAWFALTYANKMAYGSATIQTTDSNLQVSIQSYDGSTIDGSAHQAEGINYWDVPLAGELDDLSYNGKLQQPFTKLTWAEDDVGGVATAKTDVAINSGRANRFYVFRVGFTNSSDTNTLYVYLGSQSSLVAADNREASSKAAQCERVVVRETASQARTIAYWVPNRASGAKMVGSSAWTGATLEYSLANCYVGDPAAADSPINSNRPTAWGSDYPNVVHYGAFSSLSEESDACDDGQFICSVSANSTYNVNIAMWAEGTDSACTRAALSGVTTLNLEFVALSKQLMPEE